MSSDPGHTSGDAPRLTEIRHALVHLHKSLVDYDRVRYEKTVGAIQSPNHFLELLMRDPWFAWLHPLSNLVVRIDQMLEGEAEANLAEAYGLLREAQALLRPSEQGDGFERSYYEALQRMPDVVLAHAQVKQVLKTVPAAV